MLAINARRIAVRILTAIGTRFCRRANLATTLSSFSWSSQPSGYLESLALFEMAWRTNSETNKDSSLSGISSVRVSASELFVRATSAAIGNPERHRRCASEYLRRRTSGGMPEGRVRSSLSLTVTFTRFRQAGFFHVFNADRLGLKLAPRVRARSRARASDAGSVPVLPLPTAWYCRAPRRVTGKSAPNTPRRQRRLKPDAGVNCDEPYLQFPEGGPALPRVAPHTTGT